MTPTLPDRVGAVVIGAGQAGLATSAFLRRHGRDHVVLERSVVGHSWKHERWASLRTLTPNWMTRLPDLDPSIVAGGSVDHDADGFDSAGAVARVLDRYARAIEAPVVGGVEVVRVRREADGFVVTVRWGEAEQVVEHVVRSAAVVVASGACTTPAIPSFAAEVPTHVHQMTPTDYHSPDATPAGTVLVVGGSASGTQLADELARAGRDVVLATAAHSRMPRRYRGVDVFRWMADMGQLAAPADPAATAQPPPSMQLVGTPEHRSLDLNTLQDLGVTVAGSVVGVEGGVVRFAVDLAETAADADRAMFEHLADIDAWIDESGRADDFPPPDEIEPTRVPTPLTSLDLADVGVVIWATGFRFSFPYLDPSWLGDRGEIVHTDGVTPVDGLVVVGMPYNRTRSSNFILGAGPDAEFVVDHLVNRS